MMRLTMILLCFILAAAAAGRYKAEAAVRETRLELRRLEHAKTEETSSIQALRAEVAYLESPERLAGVADAVTDLKPLSGAQLLTAEDFVASFGGGPLEVTSGMSQTPLPLEVASLADAIR
jgi:hypothetical protein